MPERIISAQASSVPPIHPVFGSMTVRSAGKMCSCSQSVSGRSSAMTPEKRHRQVGVGVDQPRHEDPAAGIEAFARRRQIPPSIGPCPRPWIRPPRDADPAAVAMTSKCRVAGQDGAVVDQGVEGHDARYSILDPRYWMRDARYEDEFAFAFIEYPASRIFSVSPQKVELNACFGFLSRSGLPPPSPAPRRTSKHGRPPSPRGRSRSPSRRRCP